MLRKSPYLIQNYLFYHPGQQLEDIRIMKNTGQSKLIMKVTNISKEKTL